MKTKKETKRKKTKSILFILILSLFINKVSGQTIDLIDPSPKTPKPATFNQPNVLRSPTYNPNPNRNQSAQTKTQQRNQMLIQEAERDMQQRKQQKQQLKEIYQEFETVTEEELINVNYNLPSYEYFIATHQYNRAFVNLSAMDENNYSLKDATFIIENAYYGEMESKEEFNKTIKQTGNFLLEKMDDFGYDKNSNVAKNFILFQFFSDTLQIKDRKRDLKHLPIKYDFEDYMAHKDWSKMFVTKLLKTNTGQCNSMPRLYLILAEEIGAEAFLAFSPNHSYIKFKDEDSNWYNVELTNGIFTTNSTILQTGIIKAEALHSGLYMREQTKKELLSQLFADLALGYTRKFGYDEFANEIIEKALEINPNSLNALLSKSNYNGLKTKFVFQQIGLNKHNADYKMQQYPKAYETFKTMIDLYNKIDELGYEVMSDQDYQKWLASLNQAEQEASKNTKKSFRERLRLKQFKD